MSSSRAHFVGPVFIRIKNMLDTQRYETLLKRKEKAEQERIRVQTKIDEAKKEIASILSLLKDKGLNSIEDAVAYTTRLETEITSEMDELESALNSFDEKVLALQKTT